MVSSKLLERCAATLAFSLLSEKFVGSLALSPPFSVRSRNTKEQCDLDRARCSSGARPCSDSHSIPYERAKVGNSLILPSLTRQTMLDSLEIAASAENVRLKLVAVTENHPNPRASSARRPHFRSLLKPRQ